MTIRLLVWKLTVLLVGATALVAADNYRPSSVQIYFYPDGGRTDAVAG